MVSCFKSMWANANQWNRPTTATLLSFSFWKKNMITPSNQIQQKPQNMKHMWVKQWVLQSSLQDMPKKRVFLPAPSALFTGPNLAHWSCAIRGLAGLPIGISQKTWIFARCGIINLYSIRQVWVYLDSLRLVSQDIGWFCKSNVDFAYNSIYIQPALCTLKQILQTLQKCKCI